MATIEEIIVQNQLIVGLITGIVVTFIGHLIIDGIRGYHFNNGIKKLTKIELDTYREFLGDIRTEVKTQNSWNESNTSYLVPLGNRLIPRIRDTIKVGNSIHYFENYSKMSPETKSRVFNGSILQKLEEIQIELKIFNYLNVDAGSERGFNFNREQFDNLVFSIDCVLTKL